MNKVLLFLLTFALIATLDLLWFTKAVAHFYKPYFNGLLRSFPPVTPYLPYIIALYAAMAASLVFFVLPQITPLSPWYHAPLLGGFFGLILYTFYECTNYSLIVNWPLPVVYMDIAWGTLFISITTTIVSIFNQHIH